MNTQELTQLSIEELNVRLRQAREQFFHVREQVISGKEKNHAQLKGLRRNIAQICTIIDNHS